MELLQKHFDTALESPDGIKKLRVLILTLAMQGQLVNQDQNDEQVITLLSRIAIERNKRNNSVIKNISTCTGLPGIYIPKTWKWQFLNDILIFGPTNGYSPNAVQYETPVRSLTLTATTSGIFRGEHSKFISDVIPQDSHLWLVDGDILVQRGNTIEYVGVPAIYRGAPNQFIYPDLMMKLRVSPEIDTDYIYYVMSSEPCRKYLRSHASGTSGTMPKINQATLKGLPIPIPPFAEQKRIVAKIDELMALCDKLEAQRNARNDKRLAVHTAAINRLLTASATNDFDSAWQFITSHFDPLYSVKENVVELKKAILTLAMQGKLVKQDPKDQPASELIGEIQREKDRLINEGKIKKQKELPPIKPEEVPYQVPSGWEWTRFGEIANIFNGNSINENEKELKYRGVTGIPYIGTKDVGYGYDNINYSNGIYIPYEETKFKKARKGAVLICSEGGSAGKKCGISEMQICFGNKLFAFESHGEKVLPDIVLAFYLTSVFTEQFTASMTGIIGGVSVNKFQEILFPLCPLAEQKRIVAKIDELMDLCDNLENQIDQATAKQTDLFDAVLAKV